MTVSTAQFHKINLGSALQREEMAVAKLKHKRSVRPLAVYRLHKRSNQKHG